jgi:UDP-3-O-[3-hydroxymyristoyl] glucosamine N-acyltransferase
MVQVPVFCCQRRNNHAHAAAEKPNPQNKQRKEQCKRRRKDFLTNDKVINPEDDKTCKLNQQLECRACKVRDNNCKTRKIDFAENATVGNNTEIYSNAVIYHDCKVGNNCILHAGCVVGADGFGFAPSANGYDKIPQIGIVTIEDNVEIGANTCIDRSTMGSTYVRKGVKLDNLVHLAHNVEVGENSALAAQVGVSGSTHLGKNCVVGGQSGFVGHINIADGSKFGGQSGIMGSIKEENKEFMGTPIQPLRQYLISNARFRHIDEMARKLEKLEKELAELKDRKEGK